VAATSRSRHDKYDPVAQDVPTRSWTVLAQDPSILGPGGKALTTRISVPALDAALDALGAEIDPEKQKAAAATMQTELAAALPEIPLYYRAETTGVSNHVGGWVKFNPSSAGPTWDADKWSFIP
jgi:ABC-type transport system substrate-binding protein